MSKPKVFVTRIIPDAGLAMIKEACDADIWNESTPPSREYIEKRLQGCDGLVSLLSDKIDAGLLDVSPKLRVVSNYAVGYNNIDIAAATQRGIPVGNTPNVLTEATADIAFALLIAASRRIVDSRESMLAGGWRTWEPLGHLGQDLMNRTLGIVGMGRIGFAMAKRCRFGWDMNVIYHGQSDNEIADRELGARRVDFDTLLRESDFISLHCSLTDQTRGMFGLEQFRKMKRTAVFVNAARGELVKEKELYDALKSNTIFAAGLDVTDPEPPDVNNPLLRLPNTVVVPHIGSATVGTRDAMAVMCAENLIAGLTGKPLPYCVNPEAAHRKST